MDYSTKLDTLQCLWTPKFFNSRNNISWNSQAVVAVVSHYVVGCGSKNGCKRKQYDGFHGLWLLLNSLELVAKIASCECIGKQIGRVRFRCIDEATAENLIPFIQDNVNEGSTVITDGWSGYKPLQQMTEFEHDVKKISGSGNEAHELLPHVHLVVSLLKRWLNGTHQGNVSPKYRPYYLDEFAFRFNRKLSTYRGKLFYRLVQQSIDVGVVSRDDLAKMTT